MLVLASLGISSIAMGQSTAERFAEAVDLFVAGKCDKALPMFRKVHADSESPNARLYIARCLQKVGDNAAAYNEMKATIADATARAAKEPKYAKTRDAAAAELAQLEPLVALLVVAIADAPPDASAEANGEPIPIGEPVAVLPGTVSLVVLAPGKADTKREFDVEAGQTKTVALSLGEEDVEDPLDDPDAEADTGPDGPGLGAVRIAGMAIAGLGVVGVVVFAVTASSAKSEFDELVDLCMDTNCPDSEAERVADGRKLTTMANVSLAVGSVALLVGTAMIIFGGPGDEDESPDETGDLELTPLIGPGYIGLGGAF
jgi:hypothetical protein